MGTSSSFDNFADRRKKTARKEKPAVTGILHAYIKRADADVVEQELKLAEAKDLARALDTDVVWAESVGMRRHTAKTYLSPGVVEQIKAAVEEHKIELMVINTGITASQQRNLEKAWDCQVLDRTGLILAIFASRAQTKEGVLQVELAALLYQKSRLMKSWTHLERQRGGLSFVGGPGETQLELDRRMLDERIKKIRKELEKVEKTRTLQRKSRKKVPYPIISLVGYTNAGKSTLFNKLTGAEVLVKDQVFATLDPTMRVIELPSGKKVILSDTVGFISDIPTQLVAAFKATLEEVLEANILLHVIDGASDQASQQREDVLKVLEDIGVKEQSHLVDVYNKQDAMTASKRKKHQGELQISALTADGLPKLLAHLDKALAEQDTSFDYRLPLDATKEVAWLHQHAVVEKLTYEEDHISIMGKISPKDRGQFEQKFGLVKST